MNLLDLFFGSDPDPIDSIREYHASQNLVTKKEMLSFYVGGYIHDIESLSALTVLCNNIADEMRVAGVRVYPVNDEYNLVLNSSNQLEIVKK